MRKFAVPLSVLALAALGACTTIERPAETPFSSARVAPQPVPYATGMGTIVRINPSPSYVPSASAAGGTARGAAAVTASPALNRLVIRMDSGITQYIDTDSNEFRPGMRIEVLPDHTLRPNFG